MHDILYPTDGDGVTQYVPGTAANARAPSLPQRVIPPPAAPPLPGACAGSVLPARQSTASEARWVAWRGARGSCQPWQPLAGCGRSLTGRHPHPRGAAQVQAAQRNVCEPRRGDRALHQGGEARPLRRPPRRCLRAGPEPGGLRRLRRLNVALAFPSPNSSSGLMQDNNRGYGWAIVKVFPRSTPSLK